MCKFLFLTAMLFAVHFGQAQRIFRPAFDSMTRIIDPGKKDTQQVFTLLRMAEFHIGKPGAFKPDLDSAKVCIERARAINVLLRSRDTEGYMLLVESLLYKEEPAGEAAGEKTNMQAVAMLKGAGDPLLLGMAWEALAAYGDFYDDSVLVRKIDLLEKALTCFNDAGNVYRQGECLEKLADLYLSNNNSAKARQCGILAIARFRQAGYPNIQGACINVSYAYSTDFDYGNAIKYAIMALNALKDTRDSSAQFCQVNNTIGMLYSKMNDCGKATRYFEVALAWARGNHDMSDLYIVLSGMVSNYVKGGQAEKAVELVERGYGVPDGNSRMLFYKTQAMAYAYAGQFDKARIACDQMDKIKSDRWVDQYLSAYAGIQLAVLSHRYKNAATVVPAFRQLIKGVSDSITKSSCYWWLFRLDTGRHEYVEAVKDLLNRDLIKDSVFNTAKTRQIEELQTEYSTEEKENSIKLLQKESELQKRDIAHSNQTRNYSIAGAALLLAVGFGRYRLKQRQHFQLELKQREISAKNGQLEKLLRENEWLLREVHHRVKNNLQIVMSLLGSQSARLRDPAALSAVLDSRHRIQSIALIHQKLYKNENVSTMDMGEYIRDMVQYLRDMVKPGQQIVFDVKVEPVALDVVQAVPLGLILNEVVTNSIKYAFPAVEEAVISIALITEPGGRICLEIADNGVGLPADLDPFHSAGFGMRLIRGLADDLGADVGLARAGGTVWKFTFLSKGTAQEASA